MYSDWWEQLVYPESRLQRYYPFPHWDLTPFLQRPCLLRPHLPKLRSGAAPSTSTAALRKGTSGAWQEERGDEC